MHLLAQRRVVLLSPLGWVMRPAYGDAVKTLERILAAKTDACILWPHGTDGKGYGKIRVGAAVYRTAALACERTHGPRPDGMEAAHSCGVSMCVNGAHLRWATPAENQADRVIHGTSNRGANARLTAGDVLAIRTSDESRRALANRYRVHKGTIDKVLNRRTWAWLEVAS